MLKKISQSFQKEMREYLKGNVCGHIIREKYVNDRFLVDPEREPGALELGCYVEYLLTGAIPKDGKVPVPQYMSSAIKKNGGKTEGLTVADMYVEYRVAHANTEALRLFLASWGLTIIEFGKSLTKGRFNGTLDLICQASDYRTYDNGVTWEKDELIVIDLKYSGLMGERGQWSNPHGWQWSNVQKEYHGTQAKQYHYLTDWKFFFLVCQSNNKEGTQPLIQFFHVPVSKQMIDQHIMEGNHLFDKLKVENELNLFDVRAEYYRCEKCPLKNECKDRVHVPSPILVDLMPE